MTTTDLVLQQWPFLVQLGITLMIAVFFVVLARSTRLPEVRAWTLAYVANVVAVLAAFSLAAAQTSLLHPRLGVIVYATAKTFYALLLVRGTQFHIQRERRLLNPRYLAAIALGWGIFVGFIAPLPEYILPFQWLIVGLTLIVGAWRVLLHPKTARSNWLGWILLAEGILFLHYVPVLLPVLLGALDMPQYMNYSSAFDAGADLLLALSTLVALESSSSEHLRTLNERLLASQEQLRQLVDLDPLTGLMNRRGLRDVFSRLTGSSAALIFLDIDAFKKINDRSGHAMGDVCLLHVATVMRRTFRPDDALLRWGGDEFLIVAPGLGIEQAQLRVRKVREGISELSAENGGCSVSVGLAILRAGGEPEASLKEADLRMYEEKKIKRELGTPLSP